MGIDELVSVLGPIGGVAVFMWMNRDKSAKTDPVKELAQQITAMDRRLIRIETLVERIEEKG